MRRHRGAGHVKIEAGTGVMWPQALGWLEPAETGRGGKHLSLGPSTLGFLALAFRTMREKLFVVLSHPICVNLLHQLLLVPGNPWLVAASLQTLSSSHGHLVFPYIFYKHPSLELGPTQTIPDDHISILNLITSSKNLSPNKLTFTGSRE